jgi:hypothetical protein
VDASRIDNLAKLLAVGVPRRRLIARLSAAGAALLAVRGAARPVAAATEREVASPICASCFCAGTCYDARDSCCDGYCPYNRMCIPCGGVAGGGTVRLVSGAEAVIALAALAGASVVQGEEATPQGKAQAQPVGLLRWADPGAGLTFESFGLNAYEPVRDLPGVREVRGWLRANGAGMHPFVLRLADVGPDGRGQDTVALAVGDAVPGAEPTGLAYAAEGVIVAGDLVGTWTMAPPPDDATPAP